MVSQQKRRTPEQNHQIPMDSLPDREAVGSTTTSQQSELPSPRYVDVMNTPDPDRITPEPDRTTAQPVGMDPERSGYEVPISHCKKPSEEPIYHEVDDCYISKL